MPFMPATSDRCSCGWALGENLSGDCTNCNEANVQLGSRRGRKCGTAVVSKKTPSAVAGAAPDVDEFEQEKLAVHPKQRLPVKQRSQDARKDSKVNEKAAENTEQTTNVILKNNADELLFANGFSRTFHLENRHRNANVDCPGWMILHTPRDGHCLWHCLLSILHERHPNSVIQNQNQLREAVVSFYESHDNQLHVGEHAFSCEYPHAIRTARDNSGMCLHYGGLPEAVGFALKFKISLEVYAPETFVGPFTIPAGGASEAIIQTLGWNGVRRRRGSDHWQRMMCTVFPVCGDAARFVKGESCTVSVEGNDVEAKMIAGKGIETPEGPVVYCFACETHYGQPLGNFPAAKVRRVERVVISDNDGDNDQHKLDAPVSSDNDQDEGVDDDHPMRGMSVSSENDQDESIANNSDDDQPERGMSVSSENDQEEGVQNDGDDHQIVKRAPGRKPNASDADTTNWCQDTLVTFLRTVVAHNPFLKQGASKLCDKWLEVANEMARCTRHLGVHAVTARPDTLRIKFARLKTSLKNFRASGKCSRQSGIASVRAKNENMAELADIMDECLNLQKDVDEHRQKKKESHEAAKKCNSLMFHSFIRH